MWIFLYTHDSAYVFIDEEENLDGRENVPAYILEEMHSRTGKIIFSDNKVHFFCGRKVVFDYKLLKYNNVIGIGANVLDNAMPDRESYCHCKNDYQQTGHFINSVTIPEGIKLLAHHAFYNECKLNEINLPSTLLFMGEGCFAHTALTSIDIPLSLGYIGDNCFEGTTLTEVRIPDNVEYLGHCAFQSCEQLRFCKLPNKLQVVNGNCFQECYQLEGITIPNTVEAISECAFESSGLRSISFAEGLLNIDSNAFANCESLFSVTLPRSVSHIADDAFDPPEKNPLLTFYVYPGSYGLMWAREHGYPVRSAVV